MSGCATTRPELVEHKGVARLADMDRRDHIPDQFQIDHGNCDPVAGPCAGHGNGHVGLGTFVQRHRAVPDPVRTRAEHGGVVRPIDAAVHHIRIDAGNAQPLDAGAVDERDLDDRRHLPHQPQDVEAVPLVHAVAPGQLHRPLQLVGDVVEKARDLPRRRYRLGAQTRAQHRALIAIAEPGLARPIRDQRDHDRDEQREKVFVEQRAARPRHAARIDTHSITSSACSSIPSGSVKPIAFAVFRLIAN